MNKSEEQAINDLKNKGQAWARIILRYIDKLQGEVKLYEDQRDYVANEYSDTIEELRKENKELQKENKELKEHILKIKNYLK